MQARRLLYKMLARHGHGHTSTLIAEAKHGRAPDVK
jgi:hypothetical protein